MGALLSTLLSRYGSQLRYVEVQASGLDYELLRAEAVKNLNPIYENAVSPQGYRIGPRLYVQQSPRVGLGWDWLKVFPGQPNQVEIAHRCLHHDDCRAYPELGRECQGTAESIRHWMNFCFGMYISECPTSTHTLHVSALDWPRIEPLLDGRHGLVTLTEGAPGAIWVASRSGLGGREWGYVL